jgi:hypothetical protein
VVCIIADPPLAQPASSSKAARKKAPNCFRRLWGDVLCAKFVEKAPVNCGKPNTTVYFVPEVPEVPEVVLLLLTETSAVAAIATNPIPTIGTPPTATSNAEAPAGWGGVAAKVCAASTDANIAAINTDLFFIVTPLKKTKQNYRRK